MEKVNWGLPDWTKGTEYPALHSRITTWAWQFLRRWPEYRTFWIDKIEPFIVEEIDPILHDKRTLIGASWPYHQNYKRNSA
jgi:hypothetical protein